jgi:3-phosphoshikimate 1-carboxyvinyltransferase
MLKTNLEIPDLFEIEVPGDKSVSHRSVLFSALAEGTSKISGFLEAEDPLNTMKSFSKLGVNYSKIGPNEYRVDSPGKKKLHSPTDELDFGNGGTGIRLAAGLIAGLPNIRAVLNGDESLRKRPMKRIIDPLRVMGSQIKSFNDKETAPLEIIGRILHSHNKHTAVLSSAQVKSCLMLAAISSDVELDYEEPELSRDHTENMLQFLGGKLEKKEGHRFIIKPPFSFKGAHFKVPGDISSAAFFIVLGLLAKKGNLLIKNIGLNPARIGILTVLRNMGGKIIEEDLREECGEITGNLRVYPSTLKKTEISKDLIPSIIDEIPILTIAGLFSEGGFKISHAEDLRAKESDRIHSMVHNLKKLKINVEEHRDGYEFSEVQSLELAMMESFMDHRIAMSFLILNKVINLGLEIDDSSWIETSFPTFHSILARL